jgi:hypothetical protein
VELIGESEYMISEAGCVGVMFFDPQIGFMIQEAIQNVGSVAQGLPVLTHRCFFERLSGENTSGTKFFASKEQSGDSVFPNGK